MKLLRESEVAAMIAKSTAWLQRDRWLGGGIPFRKVGRSVRYEESTVLNWIEKNAPERQSTSQQENEKSKGVEDAKHN